MKMLNKFDKVLSKPVRRASRKLVIPQITSWRISRRRLRRKPYRIQLLQTLQDGDMQRRLGFCTFFLEKGEEGEQFSYRIIFSDEATFQLNENVKHHNVQI